MTFSQQLQEKPLIFSFPGTLTSSRGPGVKRLEFFRVLGGIYVGIAASLPAVAPRKDSVVSGFWRLAGSR